MKRLLARDSGGLDYKFLSGWLGSETGHYRGARTGVFLLVQGSIEI